MVRLMLWIAFFAVALSPLPILWTPDPPYPQNNWRSVQEAVAFFSSGLMLSAVVLYFAPASQTRRSVWGRLASFTFYGLLIASTLAATALYYNFVFIAIEGVGAALKRVADRGPSTAERVGLLLTANARLLAAAIVSVWAVCLLDSAVSNPTSRMRTPTRFLAATALAALVFFGISALRQAEDSIPSISEAVLREAARFCRPLLPAILAFTAAAAHCLARTHDLSTPRRPQRWGGPLRFLVVLLGVVAAAAFAIFVWCDLWRGGSKIQGFGDVLRFNGIEYFAIPTELSPSLDARPFANTFYWFTAAFWAAVIQCLVSRWTNPAARRYRLDVERFLWWWILFAVLFLLVAPNVLLASGPFLFYVLLLTGG
jgi:hypothetical protein